LPNFISRLPPAVVAVVLQGVAFVGLLLAFRLLGFTVPPLRFALLCGLLASALSHCAGQAKWWQPIQLLFAPSLVIMQTFDFPPGYYLAAFLLLLVVYWSTFQTQVPLYLSSRNVWIALDALLPSKIPDKSFAFMDVGSGLGGVLAHLAKSRPEGRYHGVESAPLPFVVSWLRFRLGGYENCRVHWGNLWASDLGQYDVVFAYLSPVPMQRLWQKVRSEMRPGSLFISNTFIVPEQPPERKIQIEDLHHSTLYIWRM
jgi:hypothetical protein